MTIDDKIRAALKDGPMERYDVAMTIWPVGSRAWNYSSNGGPPGWVMPMGKVIKRMRLVQFDNRHGRRMLALPRE